MEMKVNPKMVTLARESRGITQSELSDSLKITQSKLSKIEKGFLSISDKLIEDVSLALNYPKEFFYEDYKRYSGISYHRKRMSLSAKALDEINAKINIRELQLSKFLHSIELVNNHIPFFDIEEHLSPKDIAIKLRHYWNLPQGPIENITDTIEKNGGIIIMFDFNTNKIDGLSLQVGDLPPVFYINNNIPSDRMRFTIAHELGHIIMHRYPSETMENEADEFAAEFLMPERDISHQLTGLTFLKLSDLKRYWKVSMAALIMRATNLQLLTPGQKQTLWINFSKAGYRKKEPIDIEREMPTMIRDIVKIYLKDLGYSKEELSELLMLNINEYIELYEENKGKIFKFL